jgi:hypothetical protein
MATWQLVPDGCSTTEAAASNAWAEYQFTDFEVGTKPSYTKVGQITIVFSNIVTAASFDWYLSVDEAGGYPITGVVEAAAWQTLADGSTQYTAAVDCETAHAHIAGEETTSRIHRTLYLQLKLNAGTANVIARAVYMHAGRG